MFVIDSLTRASVLILPGAALCLVLYLPPGSGSEPGLPNAELIETDQAIIETQAELDRVLTGYDPDAIAEVGRRLRRLKQRRERISAEIAADKTHAQTSEVSQLVRQREGMRSRLADLEGQIQEAAGAFNADPGPTRAARLRDLNLELIQLRGDLDKAERAARGTGPDPKRESGTNAP